MRILILQDEKGKENVYNDIVANKNYLDKGFLTGFPKIYFLIKFRTAFNLLFQFFPFIFSKRCKRVKKLLV